MASRPLLDGWELEQVPYLQSMPDTPLFSLLGELARSGGQRELERLLSEEQERIKAILKSRVKKQKEILAYRQRDLDDFEELLKKINKNEVKL